MKTLPVPNWAARSKTSLRLATGVVAGLELGSNSAAALITRGMAEMTRLAMACGGRRDTLSPAFPVSAISCSPAPVAFHATARSVSSWAAVASSPTSSQGLTARSPKASVQRQLRWDSPRRYGVEMPITEQVAAILHEDKSPKDAIRDLMTRPGRTE